MTYLQQIEYNMKELKIFSTTPYSQCSKCLGNSKKNNKLYFYSDMLLIS